MFEYIHEIAVLVASLLALAVGNVWYSSLAFGPAWLRAQGKPEDADILPQSGVPVFILKSLVIFACFFSVMAVLGSRLSAAGISTAETALLIVAAIAAYMAHATLWEQRPLSYFLINVGYAAVVTFGGSAVIAYWPW